VSVVIEDGADASATVEAVIQNELELYGPMRSVIAGDWAKEALAHRRAATRSYVLLHVPTAEAEVLQEAVSDVALVARSHGSAS
jgi:hypothetical protein